MRNNKFTMSNAMHETREISLERSERERETSTTMEWIIIIIIANTQDHDGLFTLHFIIPI